MAKKEGTITVCFYITDQAPTAEQTERNFSEWDEVRKVLARAEASSNGMGGCAPFALCGTIAVLCQSARETDAVAETALVFFNQRLDFNYWCFDVFYFINFNNVICFDVDRMYWNGNKSFFMKIT